MGQPPRPPGLNDLHVFEDGRTAKPCVRSGLCCKIAACGYGTYDAKAKRCVHLTVTETLANGAEVHGCAIYETIVQDPRSKFSPAFGAGCCMGMFNQNRDAILAGRDAQARRG